MSCKGNMLYLLELEVAKKIMLNGTSDELNRADSIIILYRFSCNFFEGTRNEVQTCSTTSTVNVPNYS